MQDDLKIALDRIAETEQRVANIELRMMEMPRLTDPTLMRVRSLMVEERLAALAQPRSRTGRLLAVVGRLFSRPAPQKPI